MGLIASTAGLTLWLWTRGQVGVGAVAAATAMALRLNGISHWVMWEMATLFEHIGTVQDGINTLSRPHAVVDAPDARALHVSRGEIRMDAPVATYLPQLGGSPAGAVTIKSLTPKAGTEIYMLGESKPLTWSQQGSSINVTLPGSLPGQYAYVLKIAGPVSGG
jgi:ATP-binding cassette subfamily B multidrug efflux pump